MGQKRKNDLNYQSYSIINPEKMSMIEKKNFILFDSLATIKIKTNTKFNPVVTTDINYEQTAPCNSHNLSHKLSLKFHCESKFSTKLNNMILLFDDRIVSDNLKQNYLVSEECISKCFYLKNKTRNKQFLKVLPVIFKKNSDEISRTFLYSKKNSLRSHHWFNCNCFSKS